MSQSATLSVESARPGDWPQILACVNRCFVADGAPSMALTHGHCVNDDPDTLKGYLVARDGGRLVGCLSCTNQQLIIDGGTLAVGGLGQVATLPECRGQGVMSALLNAAIAHMEASGCACSDLGGDRVRYGRYGWETAGRQWQFTLTARSVAAAAAPSSPHEVRLFTGDPAEQRVIMSLHETEPRRVARSDRQWQRLLTRLNKQVWLALRQGRVEAYAVIDSSRQPGAVFEFGGSVEGVHHILHQRVPHAPADGLLLWSPWEHGCNGLFFTLAAHWTVVSPRMVRLFHLRQTLEAFAGQMSRRLGAVDARRCPAVTLMVQESGQSVTLAPGVEGVALREPTGLEPVLQLPRAQMVRLLLGPSSPLQWPMVAQAAPWLQIVFPLDFMIWRIETV
jgi:predicted N-acetyltransferase YhbS